ncbi:MAG: ATP-binding protein [Planctomycetota bacterium]|nr:ATP-binding protein [Planctomycetota bacterium]
MSLTTETVLAGLQEWLGRNMPEPLYKQWFDQIEILSLDESGLELGVPNRFFKERIEMAYRGLLGEAVQAVLGMRVEVTVSVSPRLFAAFRKARERDLAEAARMGVPEMVENPDAPPAVKPVSATSVAGLDLDPAFTFENFVVGSGLCLYHGVALRAVEQPGEYGRIYICGQHGVGKTHLLQAICHASLRDRPDASVIYVTSDRFVAEFGAANASGTVRDFRRRYQAADLLAFDDLQIMGVGSKTASQAELLRLIDDFAAKGKQLVFAASCIPAELEGVDPKLRDRLGAGFVDRIRLPDAKTRQELIVRKMRARGIDLPLAMVKTMADSLAGNVRKIEGAVSRLAAMIHIEGNFPTLSCIRMALEVSPPPARKSVLTFSDVIAATAEEFGLAPEALSGRGRTLAIRRARQIAAVLCRQLVGGRLDELGKVLGGRSHATIISIIKNVSPELFSSGLDGHPAERILFRLGIPIKPEDILDRQKSLFPNPGAPAAEGASK